MDNKLRDYPEAIIFGTIYLPLVVFGATAFVREVTTEEEIKGLLPVCEVVLFRL